MSKIALVAVTCVLMAAPAGATYNGGPVANGGKIVGTVRVTGDIPSLPPQPVFKHQETCGTTVTDERLMTGPNGALRNAVVYLSGITSGKPVSRDTPVKLDNRKCAFVPHVVDGTVGQMIQIHNDDPFLHDAQALLGPRTLFNVAVPRGRTVRRPLADTGLVHINCNVRHTWMHAYLFVGENPYHAVSEGGGKFEIDDVPPGTYTLHVWHEMLGSVEQPVTVQGGKTTTLQIELKATASEAP